MSSSVLITIPEEVASEFINHLGRLKPDIAKHITIRVLDDAHAKRVIEEFSTNAYHTALLKMNKEDFDNQYLGKWEEPERTIDHYGREYRP